MHTNPSRIHVRTAQRTAAALAVAAIAACSSVPPQNPAIAEARAAYNSALSDSNVARSAQVELQQAQAALTRAETHWAEERDAEEASHLAYIARQRVAIASAVGARATALDKTRAAEAERERVRADARAREAQSAQQQSAQAQAQAQAAQSQAESATERARRLEAELRELQAKPTPRGMVVTLGDVLFDTGSSTLRSGASINVQRLADVLRNNPDRRVLIEGFTDSVGSEATNQDLSRRRAEAVRATLITQGVSPDRIEARGYGEANPVASNDNAAGRQQNRRVEIVFSDQGGQFAAVR